MKGPRTQPRSKPEPPLQPAPRRLDRCRCVLIYQIEGSSLKPGPTIKPDHTSKGVPMANILERLDNAPQPMGVGGKRNQLAFDAAAEIKALRQIVTEAGADLARAAQLSREAAEVRAEVRVRLNQAERGLYG